MTTGPQRLAPGRVRANAMKSFAVRAGIAGWTTRTFGTIATMPMVEKSFTEWYFSRSIDGLIACADGTMSMVWPSGVACAVSCAAMV